MQPESSIGKHKPNPNEVIFFIFVVLSLRGERLIFQGQAYEATNKPYSALRSILYHLHAPALEPQQNSVLLAELHVMQDGFIATPGDIVPPKAPGLLLQIVLP